MTKPAIRTEISGRTATVILSRPERRNAVDRPTAEALASAFLAFDRNSDLSVAVLHGEEGAFCAGADLKAISEGKGNLIKNPLPGLDITADAAGPMGPSRLLLSKPVIAAIEGHAVAGGLELALWCDMRVAAESAVLGVFCRRWGVPLIDGGTVRLPRLIGMGHAMDLILTGRAVTAREALAMGLVNRVVPPEQLLPEALAFARKLAAMPAFAVKMAKHSLNFGVDLALDAALRLEVECCAQCFSTDDQREGMRAFLEKRKPVFTGR